LTGARTAAHPGLSARAVARILKVSRSTPTRERAAVYRSPAGLEICGRYTIALVSAHEKDYLLAGQGNDAPKAPHHKSAEGIDSPPLTIGARRLPVPKRRPGDVGQLSRRPSRTRDK